MGEIKKPKPARNGITVTTIVTGGGNGNNGDDLVLGTAAANGNLRGMGGNDCMHGGGGNDTLRGDAGTDVCIGGPGIAVASARGAPRPRRGDRRVLLHRARDRG